MHLSKTHVSLGTVRRGIAMIIAVVMGLAALAAMPLMTHAAELTPTTSNPRVTLGFDPEGENREVNKDSKITTDQQLTFHADWSLSGRVNEGDTFKVPLPQTFRIANTDQFTIRDDNGNHIATCSYTVDNPDLDCAIVGGPYAGVEGNIWFSGKLEASDGSDDGSEPTNPTWTVGTEVITLPIPLGPGQAGYRPPFGTDKYSRSGTIQDGKAVMDWGVYMWPGCEQGSNTCVHGFTVKDKVSTTGMPHTIVPGTFQLLRYDRAQNPDGSWVADDTEADVSTAVLESRVVLAEYTPESGWTVYNDRLKGEVFSEPVLSEKNKSFTFEISNLEVPHQYRLSYTTEADGAVTLDSDEFSNLVEINGEEYTSTITPRTQGGGGANFGEYTSFTASKKVTNEAGLKLPGEYTLTATQGEQAETLTIPADGTAINSPHFPVSGGDITVCEDLPEVEGVEWGAYTITGEGVTGPTEEGCYTLAPAGGQKIELVVTNEATPVKKESESPSTSAPTPSETKPVSTPPAEKPSETATPSASASASDEVTVVVEESSAPAAAPAGDDLAKTGASSAGLGIAGALLLLLGGAMLLLQRRRSALSRTE